MQSQRYVKGQKTRLRRELEEDSKKIKENLEEVKENGEAEVDLKDLKETVSAFITCVTRFKETTERLSMLIDEEGDEEKIEAREKEEDFYFLREVESLIFNVKWILEKKATNCKKADKKSTEYKKGNTSVNSVIFSKRKENAWTNYTRT